MQPFGAVEQGDLLAALPDKPGLFREARPTGIFPPGSPRPPANFHSTENRLESPA